jgi:hypothetical protein
VNTEVKNRLGEKLGERFGENTQLMNDSINKLKEALTD